MVKKEWPKLAHLVFTVIVALITVAASWGAARAEAANTKLEVAAAQDDIRILTTAVQALTTNGAVNQEVIKNINEKLERIQGSVDDLGKKIDQLPRGGKHERGP
jgi:hypothetical protein